MVFAGYGADTECYSDYSELNIEGKVVAFLNGEPMDKNGKFLTNNSYVPEYSIVGYDYASLLFENSASDWL